MFKFYTLLSDAGASGGQQGGGWESLISIGMMAVLFLVFYFFMIRPQKKQEKAANAMRDALQIGDEVTTIGGIIGAIVSIKEETVVIETTRDGTKIRFLRSAIRSVDVKAEDAQKN
jgi:preprotein translocase subunit YajC